MKLLSFIFFFVISLKCFAQLDTVELRDMIAICNSFTFIDLYNSDANILPAKYKKDYTSGVFGMDNKFQIYKCGNVAVINLRGSTDKKSSWLENIYSAMIPAKGRITVSGENFDYCFSKDADASVHAGYALGLAFLHKEILYHITNLNKEGIYNIIITGHSQGGALANLLKAYLENLSHDEVSKKNKFKVYAFAAPKIGNKVFSEEYNSRYERDNSSFNIVNVADPIPTFPMGYNDTMSLSGELKTLLFDRKNFSMKKVINDGMSNLSHPAISGTVKKLSYSASGQISKDLGPVSMPDYVQDINYFKLKNRIEIDPVDFPKVLKDSAMLKNKKLMATLRKDKNGNYSNKDVYVKESWMYQHKPYNYYVSVLKKYFPRDYALLKRKYLPENVGGEAVDK